MFSALIIGCGDSGTDYGDSDIIPLETGNKWVGKLWTLNEDGTAMAEETSVYYVGESFGYGDREWYEINHIFSNGDTAEGVFVFANGSEGTYSLHQSDSGAALVNLWAKFPASRNDNYYSGPGDNEFVSVTAVDTTITVVGADYICNAYRREPVVHTGFPPVDIYYLGPNVGFVQIESYRSNLSGVPYLYQLWELEYYQRGN